MNLKECTKNAFLLLIGLGGLMGLNSCSEKSQEQSQYLQLIINQYFTGNKSEIWP